MVILESQSLRRLAKEVLPPLLYRGLVSAHGLFYNIKNSGGLTRNSVLKNKHEGERCFILGNAPSLLNHDLDLLQGESIFTVSNGYLNPAYERLKPKYHCLPQLTYSDVEAGMSESKAVEWFSNMDDALGEAEIFLHLNEYSLVKRNSLFSKRRVWYVGTHPSLQTKSEYDLTKALSPIGTAPHMVLAIAMYMGFKNIYLLGIDYNFLCTRKYNYFFDRSMLNFSDPSVGYDGQVRTSLVEDLEGTWRIFLGFDKLSELAGRLSVNVFNCSQTSMLETFPRVHLLDVLKS